MYTHVFKSSLKSWYVYETLIQSKIDTDNIQIHFLHQLSISIINPLS